MRFIFILFSFLSIFNTIAQENFVSDTLVVYSPKNIIVQRIIDNENLIETDGVIYQPDIASNRLFLKGDYGQIKKIIEVLNTIDTPQKRVVLELLVVNYIHVKNFNWSFDISEGKTGTVTDLNYTPGKLSGSYNFSNILSPSFKINLQALVNNSKAKIYTNPHLLIQSGEEATIKIKETKNIVLQVASNNGQSTTLETIDAGIDISFKPIIISNDLVQVSLEAEVSEFAPISNEGETVIESDNIVSKFNIANKETIIIGGLIKEVDYNSKGGVPILRSIPLIGGLFSKKSKTKDYIEKVIYLTAYIQDIPSYSELRKATKDQNEINKKIEKEVDLSKNNNLIFTKKQ